jgi:hypothetical protein
VTFNISIVINTEPIKRDMDTNTDVIVSFNSPEQKQAFAQFMKGAGAEAFYKSEENKALGAGKMEYVEVEDESEDQDGSAVNYINVE